MVAGSRSNKVVELSSCEGAISVGLEVSLSEVVVRKKPVELSIAWVAAETAGGGNMFAAVVLLTAFIKFSLAVVHGNVDLIYDLAFV